MRAKSKSVTIDGQSASLSWCQAASVTIRPLRLCTCGVPCLTRGRLCGLQFVLVLASAVIFTAVKITGTYHLCLQVYMSAFYTVSFQESGSLWTPTIYSFSCKSSICIYTAWHSRSCPNSSSLRYNDCLVIWTFVRLTATKFKPLIFCVGIHLFRCREHLHFHDFVWHTAYTFLYTTDLDFATLEMKSSIVV
jgi:hypothetical protein